MSVIKKLLVIFLTMAILSVGLISFSCGNSTVKSSTTAVATDITAGLTAQQISDNTIAASPDISAFKTDMNMTMSFNGTIGSQSLDGTATANATGQISVPDKEMVMSSDVTIDIPGISQSGPNNISETMYVTAGWMYLDTNVPGTGNKWIKMPVSDARWNQQDLMSQSLQFLKSAVNITSAGSQVLDGTDCWVLQVEPDMAALSQWVSGELQSETGLSLSDISTYFTSFKIIMWVTKDTYLPKQANIDLSLDIPASALGSSGSDNSVDLTITAIANFHDYGVPLSLQLPPEASNAQIMQNSNSPMIPSITTLAVTTTTDVLTTDDGTIPDCCK